MYHHLSNSSFKELYIHAMHKEMSLSKIRKKRELTKELVAKIGGLKFNPHVKSWIGSTEMTHG